MIGLILCIVICGLSIALFFYNLCDEAGALLGTFVGVFLGFVVFIVISIPIFETSETISHGSIEYKIETINGQYWKTNSRGKKEVYYIDEGKELQSYAASPNEVEYSDEIIEPVLVIEECEKTGWLVNIWCAGDTDYTNYKVIMPRIN